MITIRIGNKPEDLQFALADLFMLSAVNLAFLAKMHIASDTFTAEEVRLNLTDWAEGKPERVREVLMFVADNLDPDRGPSLTVIDGGKTD